VRDEANKEIRYIDRRVKLFVLDEIRGGKGAVLLSRMYNTVR